MKKSKFIIDVLINIFSSALPLMVLQLVSLPLAASRLGAEEYGILITIISIITVVSFPFGNVLNNLRLLNNQRYSSEKVMGDFNFLLFGSAGISSLIMIIASILFFPNITFVQIILLVLITVLSLLKDYLIVEYRISLDYKSILFNNVFLSLGYLIGSSLFWLTSFWEFIYLTGLILSFIYIILTTKILKEPLVKTKLFRSTFKDFLILYASGLLKNLMNYADKIILLPILGPKNVSIYYAASIIGKIVTMVINPINTVILSYLSKLDKISINKFIKIMLLIFFTGLLGYGLTIFISPFFLKTLYPQWAEESIKLVYVTSATAIIVLIASVLHPFNLRFNSLKWQIYINLFNLIFYIITTFFFTEKYGLLGFSWALLSSAIFNLVFQLFVYFYQAKKDKSLIQ